MGNNRSQKRTDHPSGRKAVESATSSDDATELKKRFMKSFLRSQVLDDFKNMLDLSECPQDTASGDTLKPSSSENCEIKEGIPGIIKQRNSDVVSEVSKDIEKESFAFKDCEALVTTESKSNPQLENSSNSLLNTSVDENKLNIVSNEHLTLTEEPVINYKKKVEDKIADMLHSADQQTKDCHNRGNDAFYEKINGAVLKAAARFSIVAETVDKCEMEKFEKILYSKTSNSKLFKESLKNLTKADEILVDRLIKFKQSIDKLENKKKRKEATKADLKAKQLEQLHHAYNKDISGNGEVFLSCIEETGNSQSLNCDEKLPLLNKKEKDVADIEVFKKETFVKTLQDRTEGSDILYDKKENGLILTVKYEKQKNPTFPDNIDGTYFEDKLKTLFGVKIEVTESKTDKIPLTPLNKICRKQEEVRGKDISEECHSKNEIVKEQGVLPHKGKTNTKNRRYAKRSARNLKSPVVLENTKHIPGTKPPFNAEITFEIKTFRNESSEPSLNSNNAIQAAIQNVSAQSSDASEVKMVEQKANEDESEQESLISQQCPAYEIKQEIVDQAHETKVNEQGNSMTLNEEDLVEKGKVQKIQENRQLRKKKLRPERIKEEKETLSQQIPVCFEVPVVRQDLCIQVEKAKRFDSRGRKETGTKPKEKIKTRGVPFQYKDKKKRNTQYPLIAELYDE